MNTEQEKKQVNSFYLKGITLPEEFAQLKSTFIGPHWVVLTNLEGKKMHIPRENVHYIEEGVQK